MNRSYIFFVYCIVDSLLVNKLQMKCVELLLANSVRACFIHKYFFIVNETHFFHLKSNFSAFFLGCFAFLPMINCYLRTVRVPKNRKQLSILIACCFLIWDFDIGMRWSRCTFCVFAPDFCENYFFFCVGTIDFCHASERSLFHRSVYPFTLFPLIHQHKVICFSIFLTKPFSHNKHHQTKKK